MGRMTRRPKPGRSPEPPRLSAKSIATKLIAAVVVIGALVAGAWIYLSPGKYEAFAQCLTTKGATFYGAFWCPHCQAQKRLFGRAAKHVPYVECSTPDGKGQLPVCKEKRIEGYPLWEFADGQRKSGEVSLADLSRKTGCPLPNQG